MIYNPWLPHSLLVSLSTNRIISSVTGRNLKRWCHLTPVVLNMDILRFYWVLLRVKQNHPRVGENGRVRHKRRVGLWTLEFLLSLNLIERIHNSQLHYRKCLTRVKTFSWRSSPCNGSIHWKGIDGSPPPSELCLPKPPMTLGLWPRD